MNGRDCINQEEYDKIERLVMGYYHFSSPKFWMWKMFQFGFCYGKRAERATKKNKTFDREGGNSMKALYDLNEQVKRVDLMVARVNYQKITLNWMIRYSLYAVTVKQGLRMI